MVGEGVSRGTVIDVLRRHNVDVSPQDGSDDPNMFVLAKGPTLEVKKIPPTVGRQTLHYFERTYGAPIHQFYNPLMAPKLPGEKIH
jgi:hypothetical protein